ncbi:MAG: SDR family NAD(P)-dependent oxidoreductase [Gammaproteobacteria bacterium]|nr:SDR family NAD(P)-dependent oxidoreductase [Gammaproteobacteria bacterium]
MGEFTGRVVIITGAAGNLGQACAQAFAQTGAKRALVDRSTGRLAPAQPASAEIMLIEGIDLADAAQAAKAVEAVRARFGRVDVLVNTAGGFAGGKKMHEDGLDVWERMQRVNLHTALNACRATVPHMLKQGGGRIVNVSARAALAGVAGLGAYGASKNAVIYLTQTLAAELKDQGINVNCVLPGTIDTPQNRRDMPQADFAKWVAPAAVADAILFLASDNARAVTGAALPVYGRS